MKKYWLLIFILLPLLTCSKKEMKYWESVQLRPGLDRPYILGLTVKKDGLLVGTYRNGAFFSADNGKSWKRIAPPGLTDSLDTTMGVFSGDWQDDYFILPVFPFKDPGTSSIAMNTSSGTSYSESILNCEEGRKPKRG